MAYGTESGAVIVDIVRRMCILNVATPDLYGGADPYQRVPKSPKRTQPPDSSDADRCRSPSIDQVKDYVQIFCKIKLDYSSHYLPYDIIMLFIR